MVFGMIGTWRMSYEGLSSVIPVLMNGGTAGDALEEAIRQIEDFPLYQSVGYGGLPNEKGFVELDAAYMDGTSFALGAVASVKGVQHPISVARRLSQERFNNFLAGEGAESYAKEQGFARKDMLTERAKKKWNERIEKIKNGELTAYDGHDTVGIVALDSLGQMAAGTSTSGLFMKKSGRIGDSPLSGSGLYADSEIGGATATGVGEELMKGCLSYEIVRLMGEGLHPQEAADKAVYTFHDKLTRHSGKAGAMSLICMNTKGEWGAATNVPFSFVIATDAIPPTVYLAEMGSGGNTVIEQASAQWLEHYNERLQKGLE